MAQIRNRRAEVRRRAEKRERRSNRLRGWRRGAVKGLWRRLRRGYSHTESKVDTTYILKVQEYTRFRKRYSTNDRNLTVQQLEIQQGHIKDWISADNRLSRGTWKPNPEELIKNVLSSMKTKSMKINLKNVIEVDGS